MKRALFFWALSGLWAGPALACGWDNETYHAEAKSLPCVFEVLVGRFPRHTEAYYQARIAAADEALAWAPYWVEALDMKGIALMKLGKLDEARQVFLQRAKADPEGYATHANLSTLYTFTGEFSLALTHIDAALAIEPEAHFGREKYHRMLVVYLQEIAADPEVRKTKNFLGLTLTTDQRYKGSKERFQAAGLNEDAFDALVSMVAVYGAEGLSDVYVALGDILALRGARRLAWTAYQRAIELKHPNKGKIFGWQAKLWEIIAGKKRSSGFTFDPSQGKPGEVDIGIKFEKGGYNGIEFAYGAEALDAKNARIRYSRWEEEQVAAGLPVWKDEGLQVIYEEQAKQSPRCKSPGVLGGTSLPAAPAEQESKEVKP